MSRHPDGQNVQSTGQSADMMQRVLRVLGEEHRDRGESEPPWKTAEEPQAEDTVFRPVKVIRRKRIGLMRRLMNRFRA